MTDPLFPTFLRWLTLLRQRLRSAFPTFHLAMNWSWASSPWWADDDIDTKQLALLRLLSVAHSEQLPVAPLVAALSSEQRGSYRRELRRLAKRLETMPLIAALEQTPGALKDELVLSLRFATQSGTLNETFAELLSPETLPGADAMRQWQDTKLYLIVLAVVSTLLLVFQSMIVAPTFKKICSEFEVALPSSFQYLMFTIETVGRFGWLLFFGLFLLAVLWRSARFQRFFRRHVAAQIVPLVVLLRISHLLNLLSHAIRAGRPLPAALSSLARHHYDRQLRQRLLFARNEVEQGEEVWKSLVDARILTAKEAVAISDSSTNAIRVWVMSAIAKNKELTAHYKLAARIEYIKPLVIVCFAALVLWISYAYFSVLTTFIHSLEHSP